MRFYLDFRNELLVYSCLLIQCARHLSVHAHRWNLNDPEQLKLYKASKQQAADLTLRYSCQNQCGTPAPAWPDEGEDPEFLTTCSCLPECRENPQGCCADYLEACEGQTPWLDNTCQQNLNSYGSCPYGFDPRWPEGRTLISISLDGFRIAYLNERFQHVPHLKKLQDCGVNVPYQRSSYPTVTFPNHHSIVTGLYTEHHGIVDNAFNDLDRDDYYTPFDGSERHGGGFWYGGEPIWETVNKQRELKSATYMWPASDKQVNGENPTYYKNFSSAAPYPHRIQQALEWLDLKPNTSDWTDPWDRANRPNFINLYFDEPDHAGHNDGLDQYKIFNPILEEMDLMIKLLIDGLNHRNLLNCVNIVITADHGMALRSLLGA